ncbi:uroporphyrinogen decarboxylase family protein [Acetobacterium woodii]|uniref:Methyltransferase 1 MttB16 n=1 Tax=Acetobacterium woodii (strain ATCC 29683 / DSM 1030 / JCM 2381 / KCTC 1655 / WB1) TaxID=931626 RepID=H6LIN3_ACEWD|nr:uroporphyrinogen decarboxylase family protein [Acetobacterium woodii]AFA48607.1 methyltransferase 1 MttB16 [Acetobacterium woodii DSM 1030]
MTKSLFDERVELYRKTIAFENNRTSTAYSGPATPAAHMNMTIKDFMFDTKKGFKAYVDYVKELDSFASIDCINAPYPGKFNVPLTLMWLSQIKVPGRDLPDNSLWQVQEKALIEVEDYDFIIEHGFAEFQQKFLPKVIGIDEIQDFMNYSMTEGPLQAQILVENGLPQVNSIAFTPPFEALCGGRSMTKFFMDCYKSMDKIKETQDVMFPTLIESAMETLKQTNAIGGWVGGWRGASGMVSPKIWNNLVWPYMKKTAEIFIDNGFIPIMHLDQNWDRDIERFLELPKQKFVLNTDGMTDLNRARKLLGDHVAFMGDVPAPILSMGTVAETENYVKKLIDNVGAKGLIVTSGCDSPANAKFENMVAMFKTAVEYK